MLTTRLPARDAQIAVLRQLLRPDASACPAYPAVMVWGSTGTGKTAVVRALLDGAKHAQSAYFNCIEAASSLKVLYERCLSQLAGVEPTPSNQYKAYRRCHSLAEFVRHLRDLVAKDREQARYIILDHVERLRDAGPTVLAALMRLGELTTSNTSVILISSIVWDKLRPPMGCREPILVHFPDYTRQDVAQILALDCPSTDMTDMHRTFVDLLYSVFQGPCRDLNELRHLSSLLFPRYTEPVTNGTLARTDTAKLYHHIQPYFRLMFNKIYLREISRSEWERNTNMAIGGSSHAQSPSPVSTPIADLPYYSRFLLIAAFLASNNPAKLDQRFFSKGVDSEKRQRKKGGGARSRAGSGAGKVVGSAEQTSLRSFPLERLFAIFNHILNEPVKPTVDLHNQLATLASLRLVVQVNHPDHLESPTYRCLLRHEQAQHLASSVSLTLNHYLYDPSN